MESIGAKNFYWFQKWRLFSSECYIEIRSDHLDGVEYLQYYKAISAKQYKYSSIYKSP